MQQERERTANVALFSSDDSSADSRCCDFAWDSSGVRRTDALQRRGASLHRDLREDQRSPQAFGLRQQLPGAASGLPPDRLLG
jgi:hypothetical protein